MYTFVQQSGGGSRRDPNHKSMYKCAYMYVHLSLSPPPRFNQNAPHLGMMPNPQSLDHAFFDYLTPKEKLETVLDL